MPSERAAVLKTPQQARTGKAIVALSRDNISTANSWMMVDESAVHIYNQRPGEPSTGKVQLSRAEFDRFVRWYTTGRAR